MSVTIDLGQAIHALADALDLVGVDKVLHGKRVAAMAWQCGRALGMSEPETEDLFHAGLLHDSGVSSTHIHHCLIDQLDWEGAEFHCFKGGELLGQFAPLSHLAPIVRYHHTHWEMLHALDVAEPVVRSANLIYLVDRVDALITPHYERDLLLARHAVRDTVWRLSSSFFAPELVVFAPELVALFLDLSDSEAFWLSLEARHLSRLIYERERAYRLTPISFPELRQLALIFAQVVDAKSPYTMEHSLGTARLARFFRYGAAGAIFGRADRAAGRGLRENRSGGAIA